MAFEKRDMTGALFINDSKSSDKHPDVRGYVMFNGVEYELAGWTKTSQRGEFTSLKISEKRERRDGKPMGVGQQAAERVRRPDPISTGRPLSKGEFNERTGQTARDDMDDIIPF